jgi:GINS complex protein
LTNEPLRLTQLLERREREFLLGNAKVVMRSSVDNIDVGDYRVDGLHQGETVELPRWVAEELTGLGLADITEEPFETEMFRAISKEKMMGPLQLSGLPQDFYVKMKRRLNQLAAASAGGKGRKEDLDKLRAGAYDLIGMRLSKLLSLSSSSTSVASLADKLTPEERVFFTASQSISKEWRSALLGVT